MILLSSLVLASPDRAEDIIEKALERHQVDRSIQEIEMVLTAKNGANQRRTFELKHLRVEETVYSRITFTAPSDISGTVMIVADHPNQEDPQLLYLPALQRTQRISGRARKGAFMGSDFQYSDLEYSVEGAVSHEINQETEEHCIIATALSPNTAYPFRESIVLKDSLMLTQMDYFDQNKALQKTLIVTEIREQDGITIPFESTMQNHKKGTKTTLHLQSVKLNVPESELPLSLFSPESLPSP
ncbi:MAG: outer membrane lipoprotein-sorting protein [Myxococcota bacterium]|nr:outer membrane lipoprotein-sorting protein [Myxococcota bacterium]